MRGMGVLSWVEGDGCRFFRWGRNDIPFAGVGMTQGGWGGFGCGYLVLSRDS